MRIHAFLKCPAFSISFFLTGLMALAPYQLMNAQLSKADKEKLAKKGSMGWSPNLWDPAYYRGLSAEEANRTIAFLKALNMSAMRIEPDPKAVAMHDKVDGFLRVGFRDTTRNHGWTEEEKLKLCLFQLEAESLGVFEFDSKAEGRRLAELWRKYKFEYKRQNIDWPVMPLMGKSTYVGDPEYPGMNEVQVVQMKEIKRRMDSLGISNGSTRVIKGISNFGDPTVYHGLTEVEKSELIEFLKTISADTIRSPEGEQFKRRVMHFLDVAFEDSNRSHSWTSAEKQTMAGFQKEAAKLNLLEFNTEEKRIQAQKAKAKR